MKTIIAFLSIFIIIFSMGCSRPDEPTHNPADYQRTYNITDESYLLIITDLLNNPYSYVNSKINIDGMFKKDDGKNFVYRNGPTCCYPEGVICGLEFEGNTDFLSENDWIKVSGTLSYYETDDSFALILKKCKIEKNDNRGLETVSHDHIETEIVE